jgi:hypothetical protein
MFALIINYQKLIRVASINYNYNIQNIGMLIGGLPALSYDGLI